MNKSLLASLKPYDYYLVGEVIKKIEVRKTEPTDKDWNKEVLFYMCKDEKSFAKIPKEFQEKYRQHFGKVGLKFVCDSIIRIFCSEDGKSTSINENGCCLTDKEICDYLGRRKGYAWHISQLKIYDKPQELGEFRTPKNPHRVGNSHDWVLDGYEKITRPPQSYMYCESLED